MPTSGSFDIPHVRITDHFIRVAADADVGEDTVDRRFLGLASLTESNPSAREMGEGYLAHYEQFEHRQWFLDSAAVYLDQASVDLGEDSLTVPLVRLWFLQRDYDRIRRLARGIDVAEISDAWTLYRIGESFNHADMIGQAVVYFQAAVDHAPGDLEFRWKLATALAQAGRSEEALAVYDGIIEDNPKFERAYNDRGLTRALLGDLDGAEQDFLKSLALNPDADHTLGTLASLYLNLGRPDEGRKYMSRLTRLFPNNPTYARMMAQF
jgi:tetratricopeptide (TPR) repeat protein